MGTGRGGSGGLGQGQYNMTLAEITKAFTGQTPMKGFVGTGTFGENVFKNFQNNWFQGGLQLVAGAALPKVMNKIPGRPVQKVNRMLKQIGVGDVVKL